VSATPRTIATRHARPVGPELPMSLPSLMDEKDGGTERRFKKSTQPLKCIVVKLNLLRVVKSAP
jgi:hypothetical protein